MKSFSPVFALANVLLITSPPVLMLAQVHVQSCTVHASLHLRHRLHRWPQGRHWSGSYHRCSEFVQSTVPDRVFNEFLTQLCQSHCVPYPLHVSPCTTIMPHVP